MSVQMQVQISLGSHNRQRLLGLISSHLKSCPRLYRAVLDSVNMVSYTCPTRVRVTINLLLMLLDN